MPAPLRQRLLGVGRDIAQVGPGHPWAGRYEAELGGEQLVAWLGPRAGLEWFLVEKGEVRAHGGWQSVEEAEDLHAGFSRLVDPGQVLLEHGLLDLGDGDGLVVDGVGQLDEAAAHSLAHGVGSSR